MQWEYFDWGDEACVYKGIPDCIEGVGGTLKNPKKIMLVKRVNKNIPDNPSDGYDIFFKNLAAYLLDIYFRKTSEYTKEHVILPVGSFHGGYYYRFVEGAEGFPWEYCMEKTTLEEWNDFSNCFNLAGFEVNHDISENDGGQISKNIVHKKYNVGEIEEIKISEDCTDYRINPHWVRIDMGYRSLPFHIENLDKFIKKNRNRLKKVLGKRYELMHRTCGFLRNPNTRYKNIKKSGLEQLTLKFRKEVLS